MRLSVNMMGLRLPRSAAAACAMIRPPTTIAEERAQELAPVDPAVAVLVVEVEHPLVDFQLGDGFVHFHRGSSGEGASLATTAERTLAQQLLNPIPCGCNLIGQQCGLPPGGGEQARRTLAQSSGREVNVSPAILGQDFDQFRGLLKVLAGLGSLHGGTPFRDKELVEGESRGIRDIHERRTAVQHRHRKWTLEEIVEQLQGCAAAFRREM